MGETEALSLIPFELLPLGFRFHPTDEELINNYLKRKLNGRIKPREAAIMPEVDVCRFEPWDLPDKSPIRSLDPEWFFFAPVDRKYPSGNRSNRATEAGYWKATGKDRLIKSKIGGAPTAVLVGMKKTLVFHRGRAPRGTRTNWIMHEYRAVEPEFESNQGGFVLCRLFRKSEDTLPCSSSNEVQRTDLSSPNMPSPGSMLSEADGLEEFPTPLNQATPNSDLLQEQELQSLPEKIDEERAGVVDEVKHLIPYPSKPEETQFTSNMTLDVGGQEAPTIREEGAPLFNDLAEFLGPEYQHLFSDEIPQKHMNPAILDYPSHDDMGMGLHAQLQHQMLEEDSLTELLDTMACTPEDHSAVSNYQADSATNIMPANQFYAIDNELARDFKLQTGSSNDVDSEALLTKGGLGLQASSSGSLQPATYNRYTESAVNVCKGPLGLQASSSGSLQPATYNRYNESAVTVCKLEIGDFRDLPVQHANDGSVRSLPNTAQSGFNMRKRQVFPVDFLAKQGAAERRIRLQSPVGAGGKCKVVGVINEKGLMSMAAEEVGRNSKNNVDETDASDFGDHWSEAPESAEITEVVDDECSAVVDDAVISSEKALPVNDPASTLRLRVKQSADADGNLEKVSSLHEVKPKTGIFSVHRVCVVLLVIMFLVFAGMWFFNIMGG